MKSPKLLWLFPQPLLIAICIVSSGQIILQSDIVWGGTRGYYRVYLGWTMVNSVACMHGVFMVGQMDSVVCI